MSEVMPLKKKTWSFMSGKSRISLAQLKMVMMVIGGCSLQLRCGGFGDGATRGFSKTKQGCVTTIVSLCSLEIMHSRSSLLGPQMIVLRLGMVIRISLLAGQLHLQIGSS